MRNVRVSGYIDRNGRRVRAYVQRRREAHDGPRGGQPITQVDLVGGRGGWLSRSKALLSAAFPAIVVLVVIGVSIWALRSIFDLGRTLTHDRLSDTAPMSSSSSWFSTSAVLCEGVGGATPAVRCSLRNGRHLKPAGSDPLCESAWFGTLIALDAGRAPQWVCAQGLLIAAAPSNALDTGQTATFGTLTHGPILCRAIGGGAVRCVDEHTEYGFTLGPSGYQLHAGPFG
ncbi:hypothetical protein OS121_19415 [Mycolicibacterium mucogenicum]|uniref:hypothetical protein n=1 Tax=Mycolicibacterium mucogenicum TaxID=56689 RepID=UPI00226A2B87|nr:hypothetical protein [Mycolicibacterium mucogenicum]MCX8557224.1 hypothetical protein [Mycolicibacterium mucogenicum]